MANPINFMLEPEQIVALLNEARCRVLVAPDPDLLPDVWSKIEAIRRAIPSSRRSSASGDPRTVTMSMRCHFAIELDRQRRAR